MKQSINTTILIGILTVFSFAQESDNWEWMNPKPQGNSINAVDFIDDNIGYAAGTYGTIIKTTDGGSQWKKLNSNTTQPLYSINFVSAETGFAGGTKQLLYKTIDGGATWTKLQLPVTVPSDTSFSVMDIYFINDQLGYVLGFFLSENKIWKTTDGGISWTTQTTGAAGYLTDLYFIDSLNGFAAGGALGGEIVKTTNGGSSWQMVYQPDYKIFSLKFLNSLTGFAGAQEGRIYKTTDGGNSWNSMWSETSLDITTLIFINSATGFGFGTGSVFAKTTDGGNSWYEHLLNVGSSRQYFDGDITPSGKIYAAGSYGAMIYSTDAGITFNSYPYVTEGYISDIEFVSEQTGYAVAGYAGGDILKTTDAGLTWVSQISSYYTPIYGIAFTSAETGYLAGSLKLYKTTNGGTVWTTIYTNPNNDVYTDIFFTNENTGYAVGSYGKLLRTTNAGVNWTASTITGAGTSLASLYFVNENKGYAVGDNNAAVKTTDAGVTWSPMYVTSGLVHHNNIFFSNADTGYIASTTGIFRTTNGGQTWFSAAAPSGGYSNIMFRGNFGYAVTTGGRIIKSTNAGSSWFVQPTVTDNGLYAIYFNSDNFVYAGGILGTMIKTIPTELNSGSTSFPLTVNINNGWNMVSVPGIHPVNQSIDTWWSGKDPNAGVFKFFEGYQSVISVEPGKGYWMKHAGAKVYNTGDEWPAGGIQTVPHNPIDGNAGWNLIGAYEEQVSVTGITTTPSGLIAGSVFKYSGGYTEAITLDPGYGYWVKMTTAGQINLPAGQQGVLKTAASFIKDFGKIIITDNEQKSYTLYAASASTDKTDMTQFELPPVPPAGMFDIRYSSNRFADQLSTVPLEIEMTGIQYPVKIKAEATGIILSDASGKELARLNNGEEVTLNSAPGKLFVSENLVPSVYMLEQNYPNPFNPATIIQFSIPEDVKNVKLIVYSALGEKVAELVNTALQAGIYKYSWNATDVASGMYVYQIITEKFVSTKKMMLLK